MVVIGLPVDRTFVREERTVPRMALVACRSGPVRRSQVRPFVRGIGTAGERAPQFFGGHLPHTGREGAVLASGTSCEQRKTAHPGLTPWTASPAGLDVAEWVLAAVPGAAVPGTPELPRARVGLVDGDDGQPRGGNRNRSSPRLFLFLHTGAMPRVVDAIIRAAAAR